MGHSHASMRMALVMALKLMLATSVISTSVGASQIPGKAQVHTIITSGCSMYFDWQVMGLVYS